MAKTYGTTDIPSDEITVQSGGTVNVSLGFVSAVGIVGSHDSNNGAASEGSVVEVSSPAEAQDQFGQGSDLHEQTKLAYANGASTVHAVAAETTNNTENFSSTSSGTLSNTPAVDPTVTTHEITAQDDANNTITVNIVYDSSPSTPSDADTINLNPINGSWEADASDTYDITYDYRDNLSQNVTDLADEDIRILQVDTEAEGEINTALTEANTRDNDFDFFGVIGGATPTISPGTYSDSLDDFRASVVAPSRCYTDASNNTEVRTLGAVSGYIAGQEVGISSTNKPLDGFVDLRTQYSTSELGDFIDQQVLPIKQGSSIRVVKDMTTSTDQKFERVYRREITDEVTSVAHQVSEQFIGRLNTPENRDDLRDSIRVPLKVLESDNTPALDASTVTVSKNDANEDQVDVAIGVDLVNIMDTISVDITVGDVVTGGAS